MPRAIQRFEVSLKGFIVRDECALLVREADTGYWELPGGRIDVGEEWQRHDAILAREIAEELGADFRIDVGEAAVTWVRRRPSDDTYQFIVGRVCWHLAGEPVISSEHDALMWSRPEEWSKLQFPPESDYRDALAMLWRRAGLG